MGQVWLCSFRAQPTGDLSLANQLSTFGLLFAAVLLLRRGALWLRAWTDRRFFRDAYHSEQILSSLSDEVRSIVETRPLLERVAGKIAESLHVPRVAVFLQKDGFFRPAYALGYESVPQIEFPETAVAIERLRKERNRLASISTTKVPGSTSTCLTKNDTTSLPSLHNCSCH